MYEKGKMGAEGPQADQETTIMAISLEMSRSWMIMQKPTQYGTQKNIFVACDGRDWIIRPTAPILPHQIFTFFLQHYQDVTSEVMKRYGKL
ncbi:hypothetical protein AVEN_216709-1 [Araneus ventricosus]|uniref:Uncharacterized protein n=1 Tax=Araneus ventricosus TaxID=182803 RepID=A0A4Y2T958_ARAVE|nr:hypothetical protein AVEN_216709-1 [Araneus ventricosus]